MSEPIWLSAKEVKDFHAEQLTIYGGPAGIRDEGMLESAMGRPENKWSYGESDIAVLAAANAYGIAKNHPFIDGNKRAALMALIVFLRLNAVDFRPDNAEAAAAIIALAAGEIEEDGLARWISDRWPKELPRT